MTIRATAIPLSCHPYSSTSRIVHWLTRNQGKVSTLLKGALRPKSPFLGEYELFSTSELLYFQRRTDTLHTGKECAILQRRDRFRHDWRAMQTASYLTWLIDRTTPDEAPNPELFEFFEELLDLAQEHGAHPQFTLWAELNFCRFHGHSPNLEQCVVCGVPTDLRFCASQGGVACGPCARAHKLPVLPSPPDILAILRSWQNSDHPARAVKTRLAPRQLEALHAIVSTFLMYHFRTPPEHRAALFEKSSVKF